MAFKSEDIRQEYEDELERKEYVITHSQSSPQNREIAKEQMKETGKKPSKTHQ